MEQDQIKKLEYERDRGIAAQQFLDTVKREGYFERVMMEVDNEYTTAIAGLSPADTQNFTILQARRQALYDPLNRVMMDITLGQQSKAQLDGEPVKGIL